MFPGLFQDAARCGSSPCPRPLSRDIDSRAGEVYGLYHTQNTKAFFQREDVWSVAQQVGADAQGKKQHNYRSLLRADAVTGRREKLEFLIFLPFTPGNRNNMMAGWPTLRCRELWKTSVYNFPKSSDRWSVEIEARIDQNAQLVGPVHIMEPQGSHVIPPSAGNPGGQFAQFMLNTIYLQAERSPMPNCACGCWRLRTIGLG